MKSVKLPNINRPLFLTYMKDPEFKRQLIQYMQKQSASNNTKSRQDESKNGKEEPPKMQHYDDDYCLGMWSQPDIMDMS